MSLSNIKTSAFSLAKRDELVGDDAYEVKTLKDTTIAVLCDGVGSALEGRNAAKRVVNSLINNFQLRPKTWSIEKSIKHFTASINTILYKESIAEYERSEYVTTLAFVVIEGDRLYGANLGDSRIYLLRNNQLSQLSFDHVMQESGYENVLTQAIGIEEYIEPYYFENILQEGDQILLCSDGLYNTLQEDIIKEKLSLGAHLLVKYASKMQKDHLDDDTTAVCIEIKGLNELHNLKKQVLKIPLNLSKDEVIDNYVLEKSLIQNKRTWLALKDDKKVVLKFVPVEIMDDEQVADLFVKEAWNANRLQTEFFPKAFIPNERTHRYYVMEYLDGLDLKSYLEQEQLSIDDAIKLAKFLLAMSQYLLSYDLVHGDIKPENIIVKHTDAQVEFHMIDFGSITDIFSIQSRAGTPSYLAPERFTGGSINESTEIFSVGVTLYKALTKHYPYGEIEPFSNPVFKEAKKPSVYNKNIPAWLDSVILRSIAIETDKRYEHYSEMNYELTSPQNVKPFFSKNSSIIERSPVLFYRTAFIIMLIVNFLLFVFYNMQ